MKRESARCQRVATLTHTLHRNACVQMPPRTNRRTKKQRSKGGGSVIGELRDLPDMTLAEARKEREDCFARAWAKKRAREAAQARGEIFVPEWQKAAAAKEAATKAPQPKPQAPKRKADQPPSSDSD